MNMPAELKTANVSIEDLSEPLTFPVEAYISEDYARAEADKLWARVWQHAGRVEEIPDVGNYLTYEVGRDSILIVRTAPDTIKAYHNVCPHRGRRLVGTPPGANHACGTTRKFACNYHAWTFNLDGKATYILDKDDWKGALTDARTSLAEVRVDTWGGWIWINMDPNCVPLREYLDPIPKLLDPFEFQQMRYKFRQWVIFDCNWKVALEAFLEPYHVMGTHPQLMKYGDFYAWSKSFGLHGSTGYDTRKGDRDSAADSTVHRAAKGSDARKAIAQMQQEFMDTIGASTTETLVKAALRLVDELPEGTPAQEVHRHWLESARRDDAARGVSWPTITDRQMGDAGLALSIFPNMNIIPGPTFALYYRLRPYLADPNKCIYEAVALERFPAGQEPKTELKYAEATEANWRAVIAQDFSNMIEVQRGLHSRGFRGNLPNPHQEQKVTNLHLNLARYMGTGAPRKIG
jgi:phenylpropionate dioxygenase-like ring-hydroxylating dioxygenase large terminal subunit